MMAISNLDDGKFVDVNNAFLKLFGYTREEVIGNTSKQLNMFGDNRLRDEILIRLSQGEPVREIETPMLTKTGELKIGLLSADQVMVGETRCMLTVNVDITDRKKMEEQLKFAQEEANRANLAKSEFLSRMSHELRTPMNSILGFAQLLEMGELNSGQMKGVKHILNSGKHLLDLINEVLEISRIEAGKMSLSPEPIQVSSIIHEMMEIVWPLIKERQLTVDLTGSNMNQLYILADRQRLKQVLLNLINNAIKYNKTGGSIKIDSSLMPENERGFSSVRISITDTGIGILPEKISLLFNPFERIGAEQSATEGTGLGLAVVKKLVDAMNGTVGVESRLGEGSTFWIELPFTKSQLNQFDSSENYNDFDNSLFNRAGTILYIEDNVSNIELVEQIIFAHCNNIRLISNMNGNETVSMAMKYHPDLILLDLNLPDMHGSEVLEQLRSNENTGKIPVVIISADATPQQLEKLKKKGADYYLTKPLDVKELLKMISKTIRNQGTGII
jgi:PAS domain S-box-containing protein